MDKYEEKQAKLLYYLNHNKVYPTPDITGIVEIFDVEFIYGTGWWIINE